MLNNAGNLNQDKSTNRRPWVSSGTQTMEMCPTACITLACLITFHHFQSCLRPPTIPTAQALLLWKLPMRGSLQRFSPAAQKQWCPGHFLSPKTGGRSSDHQCAAAALHTGESLRERALLGTRIWGLEYSEMTSSRSQSSATFKTLQAEELL